ncbi:ABC transporter ATP-binding protein [uncultured Sphaerochaeta sp.]|uniref:ABC transporter ATP-binding protein n=1 Tax=uncultured Sphaerochaeta sp. TaxID=886478 RepID=UPI002A0A292D|nr:ABC transporter ATP-binding protein [uncultured Sphaerochaeta sp.]
MLKIENLSINYGYISALRNVNLVVNEGELVTLIGGNGAGKTSTLMGISNLIPKTGGKVFFKDREVSRFSPEKIVKMGLAHVPEGRKIFPDMSVYENLVSGSMGQPGQTKEKFQELLEMNYQMFPRLKERLSQSGGSLSGGEQQMLAIARGLMMDPDLIMLDEPSLGLAPIIVEEIFELLVRIRKNGKTILLIEQNASMALSIADRGYVLETGDITLEGSGKELLDNPAIIKAYLGG